MEQIQPWHWAILGAALMCLEILSPGIFLVWFGIAAVIMSLLVFLLPMSMVVQVLLFALLSLLSAWAGKRVYARFSVPQQVLNAGNARLMGKNGIYVVTESGNPRVRVGDSTWSALPDEGAVSLVNGAPVTITGVKGTVLLVSPVSSRD